MKNLNTLRRRIFSLSAILALCAFLTGCDTGIRQMGPTQFGVRFRQLPQILGGGISDTVAAPGQTIVVMPWDSLYRLDASVKYVTWGGKNKEGQIGDYVYTRALDGNEVALAVTIQYRLSTEPEKLKFMIQNVGTTDDDFQEIIISVARAYIRTYMNELKTSAFFVRDSRYEAIEKVKTELQRKLSPQGIEVQSVIFNEHRFERLLADGTTDTSYQQKIDETQKLREDTEREHLRIETIKAKKQQELNDTQGAVNRQIAEADGFKKQAILKGDGYYASKENEAKAILAKGTNEAEGLKKQIEALSGPGGRALLKLQLAKELLKSSPQFVVLGEAKGQNGIDVKKIDTNELLRQIGLFEGLKDSPPQGTGNSNKDTQGDKK